MKMVGTKAQTSAEITAASSAVAPACAEPARDAGIASDAFASLATSSGTECLHPQLPEWPEKATYIYL